MSIGMMFPGVTHVLVTQKETGATRVVSHADMKATLKPKDFERLSHEVFMWGKFEDSAHTVTIHTQEKDYNISETFM